MTDLWRPGPLDALKSRLTSAAKGHSVGKPGSLVGRTGTKEQLREQLLASRGHEVARPGR